MYTVTSRAQNSRNGVQSLSPNKKVTFANMTSEELKTLMSKIKSDRQQHLTTIR